MSAPFTVRMLRSASPTTDDHASSIPLSYGQNGQIVDTSYLSHADGGCETPFSHLLPATCRSGPDKDEIQAPQPDNEFLERELAVDRLDNIKDVLWMCGRPMPPRPLHHQLLIKRNIALTEDPHLHLVWTEDRIFVKPLARWILEPGFWFSIILDKESTQDPRRSYLIAAARGMLHSYCALVAYESDFRIAQAEGLLPPEIAWSDWKVFCRQVLEGHSYAAVSPRYLYGELRLGRLNLVSRFAKGNLVRGYSSISLPSVYTQLLAENFAVLTVVLGYIIIILSAMQVGLTTKKLEDNDTFQAISWGFTVFSVVAPLSAGLIIIALFLVIFLANWLATNRYERRRLSAMGLAESALRNTKR